MRIACMIGLAVAFLAAGCARHRTPMPIGIFRPPARVYSELADAGFNLIVHSASQTNLAQAHEAGLSVLMTGGSSLAKNKDQRDRLVGLDRHPAAFGWYLFDEPDLHQVSPRRMLNENRRLKRYVRKPTVLVLAAGSATEKYTGITDILAVDWYPVPWSSVGTVAREMRLARLGADHERFLAILQGFDWNFASNLLNTEVPLRAPTFEELRCMTYLALMQGASGIIFYAYQATGWDLESHPSLREAVLQVGAEIRVNEAIFGKRISWWPIHSEYHGPPDAMFNEIGEARISLALFRAKRPAKGYYLLAANTTSEPTDFSFKLPINDIQELPTSCPGDEFEAQDGWIRKTYGGYEVCIFGPFHGEIADK